MKEVTLKVYKYKELPQKGKDAVKEMHRKAIEQDRYEYVFPEITGMLRNLFGVPLFITIPTRSGSCLYNFNLSRTELRGASVSFSYDLDNKAMEMFLHNLDAELMDKLSVRCAEHIKGDSTSASWLIKNYKDLENVKSRDVRLVRDTKGDYLLQNSYAMNRKFEIMTDLMKMVYNSIIDFCNIYADEVIFSDITDEEAELKCDEYSMRFFRDGSEFKASMLDN